MSLEEDIYSLGFASLYKNELIDLALLKDEGIRPKSQYLPAQTPRGTYIVQKAGTEDDDLNMQDQDDQIYEEEQQHQEWEAKMVRIYEERTAGRNTILIHVIITAFCQGMLISLLFVDVVGSSIEDIKKNFGTLT